MRVLEKQENGLDMSADFTSESINIWHLIGYAVTAKWSGGSPVGVLQLQATTDDPWLYNDPKIPNPDATWTDIPGGDYAVNGDGKFTWNTDAAYYKGVRLVYTRTSGGAADSCDITWNGKANTV